MGRSPCCDKNGLKKGPWTPEEDMKLIQYIQTHGPGNWRTLPKNAGLERCGKSCRLRWTNYLRPDIKRGRFSFEEEETIIQLHSVLGNKWSAIAARLPGRTDNEIKNYWNTHIRKRLLRMGIDPVTHAPRLHLSSPSSLINSPDLMSQLSNLLRLHTLLNPDSLSLALSLLSSPPTSEGPAADHVLLRQKLQQQQNQQLSNSDDLLPQTTPPVQPNLFEYSIDPSSGLTLTTSPPHNHNQGDVMGNFSMDATTNSLNSQMFQNHNLNTVPTASAPSDHHPSFWHGIPDLSENSCSFQSMNSGSSSSSNNSRQNYGFDSVLSTPLSSPPAPPMNTSPIATGGLLTDEDGREAAAAFCSNDDLLRFEIPEGFDFDDFCM